VAGNRDLLEEDVLDPLLVDLLADRLDLLAAAGIVPGFLERRDRSGIGPFARTLCTCVRPVWTVAM